MPKSNKIFICDSCGADYKKWQGQCDSCGEWNTIVEQAGFGARTSSGTSAMHKASGFANADLGSYSPNYANLAKVKTSAAAKQPTGIAELDRALGGGLTGASVVLLSGDPGVGKSTLLLQTVLNLAAAGKRVHYASAEESASQVASRAARLVPSPELRSALADVQLTSATALEQVLTDYAASDSQFLVLDSIQTVVSAASNGVPGGMSQVRSVAAQLADFAKTTGKTLIIVGHIDKEGNIAGPKVLEHLVDVVLRFEGDANTDLRILRVLKNRFGPIDEVGIFQMIDSGLKEVRNVGEFFLEDGGEDPAPGSVRTLVLEGNRPLLVEIQALVVSTNFPYPKRVSEGVSISRLQTLTAVLAKYLRIKLDAHDIYLNVARGLKVNDRGADLAIALAILSSYSQRPVNKNTVTFSEISLVGRPKLPLLVKQRERESKNLGLKSITAANTTSLKSLYGYLEKIKQSAE